MRRRLYDRGEHGFTLIELLVVIIILGILAAVVVFSVSGINDRGRGSATGIDDRTIRTAQEAHCAQEGRYASGADLVAAGFLSDVPEYHEVNARQTTDPGTGNCNGWRYFITRTDQAEPYGTGSWAAIAAPPPSTQALVRLPDGRVFGRGGAAPHVASIWDPATNTWTPQDAPPIEGATGSSPSGSPDLFLVDDPLTPYSECKGPIIDNCGKILVFGSYLFDPRQPVGIVPSAQWQDLSPMASEIPGCNVCDVGNSRGHFSYIQIKGASTQCGSNCGRVAIFTDAGNPTVPDATYDILDPKTNTYNSFQYDPSGFAPGLSAQEVLFIFFGGATQLPDGRIFACCGGITRSAFMSVATASPSDPPVITEGPVPPQPWHRAGQSSPLPVLPNGSVLLNGSTSSLVPTGIYTPESNAPGSFSSIPSCGSSASPAFRCHRLAFLTDGRVLARRNSPSAFRRETYLFNPATMKWSRTGDLPTLNLVMLDALYLDPQGGPCGAYCGKVMVALDTAAVYTP